jgi:gag-polyprotein putative aspartyl protease
MNLSFDSKEGLIIVPTRAWGPNGDTLVRLALDTGATGSLLNWDVLVLLGYDPAIESGRSQITTGSGVEFVPRIKLRKIEALGLIREEFSILCHTLPTSARVDGLLGLDFLRQCRLILDFREGVVTLD